MRTAQGLVIDHVETAPMALLQVGRLVSDEGLGGAARFIRNLMMHRDTRRRVMAPRKTFRAHRANLTAVAIISHEAGTPHPAETLRDPTA